MNLKTQGSVVFRDALLNVTSINSVQTTIIQEQVLVFKVFPSADVHIIPGSDLMFTLHLTQPLGPESISNGSCMFGNQLSRSWQTSQLIYVES